MNKTEKMRLTAVDRAMNLGWITKPPTADEVIVEAQKLERYLVKGKGPKTPKVGTDD